MFFFRGESLHPMAQNLLTKKLRDCMLGLVPGCDRQTDIITTASTRLALRAAARKMVLSLHPETVDSVLEHYTPTRTLRSSDTNSLCVPRVRTCFGSRGFSVGAPTIWNSLPLDIRNSCSIASFRHQLKTFLFSTSGHL